jgi:uncharacterized protein (TIRG00374 family)
VPKVLHWLLAAAALGFLAYQVPSLLRSGRQAAGELDAISWWWVAASVVLGLAAVAAYGELHRELLVVGGSHQPPGIVESITFAENAITNTVPVVGGAGGLAYGISRFRRRGVDSALASWSVLLAGILDTVCLVVLAAVALAATGRIGWPVAAAVLALVAGAAFGAWFVVRHPAVLPRLLRPLLWLGRLVHRRAGKSGDRPAGDLDELTARVADRLRLLEPTPARWAALLAVCLATWLLDFGDLTVASAAVPHPMHWSGLVAGYLVVQAGIALQILPGGAGLSDVGLLGTLVASGVAAGPAAATVLVYRACSWLIPAVVGWLAYGVNAHLIGPRVEAGAASG